MKKRALRKDRFYVKLEIGRLYFIREGNMIKKEMIAMLLAGGQGSRLGVLTSEVVDIVENHGIKTAIVNVSFTCHMPDCLEMPYQPVITGAQMGDNSPYIYRIGGNSCLSGDFLGNWSFDHELQVGERIVFEDMIHYTTVKTTMFNGIHHPALGLWTSDNKAVIYKEFKYEDYRDRMC